MSPGNAPTAQDRGGSAGATRKGLSQETPQQGLLGNFKPVAPKRRDNIATIGSLKGYWQIQRDGGPTCLLLNRRTRFAE